MLSKEETEKLKEYFRWVHEELSTYGNENHINLETLDNKLYLLEGYIDQLETEKTDIIEKLEKEKYTIESTYSQINGNYFMAQDKLDLINEILSIMKGEKNE